MGVGLLFGVTKCTEVGGDGCKTVHALTTIELDPLSGELYGT